jgi:lipopolysaccharide exporter
MKSMDLPGVASAQAKRAGQVKPIALASSESLSKRVVRGGFWVFALRFTNRGLGFIRTIILARLLAPSDFGLLGIAMLAISTIETFSQTGFHAALVQKKENIESYLDTTWTVSVIRGVILFVLLFFSAPLVAKFFSSPQATLIIRIIALTVLLSGLRNIGVIFFQKELEFNKQFIYGFSATVVDLTVAVALAFMLRNVWALVWGGLAANFVRLLMSYILHSYRPRIRWEKEKFQELFGFGRWVLGSSVLIFLITQGDDIFVGKMLGVTALGLYQMAYLISNLPATEITHVISQVTFPAYSKLTNDTSRLRESYLRVLAVSTCISIPVAGAIFVLAPEFTKIFLGDKWIEIVPLIRILSFFGLFRSIAATTGPVFYAKGFPEILTKLGAAQLMLLIVIIYPLTGAYGLLGVSLAVTSANLFVVLLATWLITKEVCIKPSHYFRTVAVPTVGTALVASTLVLVKNVVIEITNFGKFCPVVLAATACYLCFLMFSSKEFPKLLKQLMSK